MSTNTEVGMVQGELVQGGELRLQDLAERINEEHDNCERSLRQGLQHALNAGGLLIEARSLCPHGAWATWLEDNTTVSQRTAQLYMRVARGLPVLEAKAQHVADLTLREAAALLSAPSTPETEADKARAFCEQDSAELAQCASQISVLRLALDGAQTIEQLQTVRDAAAHWHGRAAEIRLRSERASGTLLASMPDDAQRQAEWRSVVQLADLQLQLPTTSARHPAAVDF